MKPYEKLQRYWRTTIVGISTVEIGRESVGRLEARYGIRIPDDFRDYLLHSCPKDGFMDDETTEWWPLDRLKIIPDEHPHTITDPMIDKSAAKYIFFAD